MTETQIVPSDLLEEVLSSAMESGGSFAEIFVEDRRSTSAVLDDGLVEELNNALGNYSPTVVEKVKGANERDENPKDRLIKLNELKEEGLISEDDFNSKKAEILKKL